jgi:hypothetical protein
MIAAFSSRHDDGVRHYRDRRQAPRLAGQARLAKEIACSENRDDGFLSLLRNNRDLDLALLDVEDRIRRITL